MSNDSKTFIPLKVKNVGFMLDRMGADCHPLQFLRELTHNSIQAIQRNGGEGHITLDYDHTIFERTGTYKLSITDNGSGMTGEEMVEFINQLSSSIAVQSVDGNYGIGAKIATLPQNPAGVIYQSWKDGVGSMIHIFRNENNDYGLARMEKSDGTFGENIEIASEAKPKEVDRCGTKVILLGRTESDSTMTPPEDTPLPTAWIARYLNTRYFCFPSGITIKAREGWESDSGGVNKLRTVNGQEKYLSQNSSSSGTVDLSGAVVRWWILKESAERDKASWHASTGHMAALFEDEIYDLTTGRASTAKLQEFGITFGCRNIVLYIEPTRLPTQKITTNLARTKLLINNKDLPWDQWAKEFSAKMPNEIAEFVRKRSESVIGGDNSKSIKDRLKPILALFNLTRYRTNPLGKFFADRDHLDGGASIPDFGSNESKPTKSNGNPVLPAAKGTGNIYSMFEKKSGEPSSSVVPDVFPIVKWVRSSDGSREEGMLEDRAARYIANQNQLLINADFRGFVSLIDRIHVEQYEGNSTIRPTVESTVHTWFEQALVETVIGVAMLKGSREWTNEDVSKCLSEEALTAVAMQRYLILGSIKKELGAKLGARQIDRLKELASAD